MSEEMVRWLINNGVAVAMCVALGVVVWFLWRKVEKLERKLECSRSRECVRGGGIPRPCQLAPGQIGLQVGVREDESDDVFPKTDRQTRKHSGRFLAPLCVLLVLCGCTVNRQERQVSRATGVQNGQPVDVTTTTQTTEATSSGVDVGAVVTAAVQASQGKILGALENLKLAPPPEFPSVGAIASAVAAQQPNKGTDWGTIGGGLVATILGALAAAMAREARVNRKEKEKIEVDRDLAYEKWIEAERQLPPR